VRIITEEDVRRLLPVREAIACLRAAFAAYAAAEAMNQVRRRLYLPTGAVLHSMAGATGNYFGTKVYATHPKHGATFTFLLYEAATAKPLATFEANHLGQIRTGAATGVAVDLLAPHEPLTVALIGAGFQARTQLEAVAAVRNVKQARVWSRTAVRRQGFAAEMSAVASTVPAESADSATEGADVIITATYSKDPVIQSVHDTALICAVGSNHPQRRELPPDIVRRARIVVDDLDSCRIEAGDLLLALADADWQTVTELKNLVSGKTEAGRGDRLTVFKSVGLGLEDVAVGAYVYEKLLLR
jgi:ornithine cyclodeaminase/alanine dehydrogenase-like protein (mu-crystallin family)